jgi:hypothetical protein
VISPLYRPDQERDACGTGFVADIAGTASFRALEMASDGPLITGSEETCPLPRG